MHLLCGLLLPRRCGDGVLRDDRGVYGLQRGEIVCWVVRGSGSMHLLRWVCLTRGRDHGVRWHRRAVHCVRSRLLLCRRFRGASAVCDRGVLVPGWGVERKHVCMRCGVLRRRTHRVHCDRRDVLRNMQLCAGRVLPRRKRSHQRRAMPAVVLLHRQHGATCQLHGQPRLLLPRGFIFVEWDTVRRWSVLHWGFGVARALCSGAGRLLSDGFVGVLRRSVPCRELVRRWRGTTRRMCCWGLLVPRIIAEPDDQPLRRQSLGQRRWRRNVLGCYVRGPVCDWRILVPRRVRQRDGCHL